MRIHAAALIGITGALLSACSGPKSDPLRDEAIAIRLYQQAEEGSYRLIGTEELGELVRSQSDMILLDVRPKKEFRSAHILGSTNTPFPETPMKDWDTDAMDEMSQEEFAEQLGTDREMPIVIYSENLESPRSHTAAVWARKLGFVNVSRYAGGIRSWKAAGNETRSIEDRS